MTAPHRFQDAGHGSPRRTVFGEVAEVYDGARPGYADELVTDVLEFAALGSRRALEVGAGTGKATTLFAARGVPVVCVEPDARMAEVLRRNTAAYPGVRVEVADFEHLGPTEERFGLLYAATSWHWVDPERRWDLAHRVLAPGGALALFWNPVAVIDPGLFAELRAIDRFHGVEEPSHDTLADRYGEEAGIVDGKEGLGWPVAEIRSDGRFTDLRTVRYRQHLRYDTERYLAFLASVSAYRVLPARSLGQLLDATGRLLDSRGGTIDMLRVNDLLLARAA
ncbi:class I SAM-dependent methyltransferase [Streptomyces sp. AM 2-1-1]|uniref:class I SAM-dependent methyltransferase n=1 Tax=Streptomyces sp. AM 2-1-1 TaxID=3028709 RepID=UPI0023BA33DB|nr:class I SAM-dependent methyltransferase [Streptomyces sp. AM 2-1-1]WEH41235.1 class I SAM-dependent methyltransferase [Streptomyces sp. AM 2-1-1]